MTPWLSVIGVGEDGIAGLSSAARALIEAAETVVGGERHLALVPTGGAERLAWERPLARTIDAIAARRGRRVAVLASGDPLWYGVGVTLARRFPEEIAVLPQPSAFTLAAARMRWPVAECECLTLHGRPLERLALFLAPGARLLVLAEDGATPSRVARFLSARGWGPSGITVLERMGGPAERRIDGVAETWSEPPGADLNTVAIQCRAGDGAVAHSRLSGLPDDAFEHDGQITKREIRAATLAALAPLPGETLWDIGAGSGSIAIEWLRGTRGAAALAVERDAARCDLIARNAAALGVPELRIVHGVAPACLEGLPLPDAVFIGGGLTEGGLTGAAWAALRPGGRLVANAVTLEGERRLLELYQEHGGELVRIAVSRADAVGTFRGWRPLMPVTQLAATKSVG